jgi:hypothetical protein
MTAKNREQYSDAQEVALVTQVDSVCPLCTCPLFYKKGGKSFKAYEIAHIYPLNPTDDEVNLLSSEEKLGNGDVNHEDNVIPLCKSCHGKYDKPRTIAEYRTLLGIKKELIERSGQQALWAQHPIEDDIILIIEKLCTEDLNDPGVEITYDPKIIDEKCDDTITSLTARKIRKHVSDYYPWLKRQMADIDKGSPGASDLISLQVKGFFLKQKQRGISQHAIFHNIAEWICRKTQSQSLDAAEIVTSFFVQNCEVFE